MLKRKRRMYPKKALFFILLVALFPLSVAAEMEVNSISAMPKFFDPEFGENVSIIVNTPASMEGLYVHVLTYTNREFVRSDLRLVEDSPGTYSTIWDGKTDNGSIAPPDLYLLRVFDSVEGVYLSSELLYVTIGQQKSM